MRAFFSTAKTPADLPEPFWRDLMLTNVQRMRVLAQIYIGITAWFSLAIAANTYVTGNASAELLMHTHWFALVPAVNIGLLALLRHWQPAADTINVRRTIILTLMYLTVVQSAAAIIGGITATYYNHITAHLMAVMLAAASIVLPWSLALLPAAISAAVLIITMRVLQPGIIPWDEMLTVLLFMPIAALTSHMLLRGFYDKWVNQQTLEMEIQANTLLAIQLKQANRRLAQLASIDELTGIANRRGLRAYIDKVTTSGPQQLAVILVDVDNFKEYNDEHGHRQGDTTLTAIARTLDTIALEVNGMAVRWGGEEFLIIVPDQQENAIKNTCYTIQQRIEDLALPHGNSPVHEHITLSQGATYTAATDYGDVLDAIHRADTALYMAKQDGRNTYKYISPGNPIKKISS